MLNSVNCRFCHGTRMEFVMAGREFCVFFCENCQIYQTSVFGDPQLPWDDKAWHLMSRLSWNKAIKERIDLLKRIIALTGHTKYSSLHLLEIGPGAGELLAAASNLGIGIFLGIELSRLNCKSIRTRGLPVILGKIENSPFKTASFDIVVMCQVIEHIAYPREALETIFHLLRPGGILHIDTPNPNNIFSRATRGRMSSSFGPSHVTLFVQESLSRLLQSVGFEIIELKGYMNSFNVASQLVYGLTNLRLKRAWSKVDAEMMLARFQQSKFPNSAKSTRWLTEVGRMTYLFKETARMIHWSVRIGAGYVMAPIWKPIARFLSQRPDTLALMEVQARKPS